MMSSSKDSSVERTALVDITAYLDACASTLNVEDPLLYDTNSFGLHDSMAALELMDPTMDCCEFEATRNQKQRSSETANCEPPRFRPPNNLQEITGGGPLPWDNLSFQDVLIVGLETLVRLAGLLDGSSAAESTYTCLYAHDKILDDMRNHLGISFPLRQDTATENSQGITFLNIGDRCSTQQLTLFALSMGLVKISDSIRSLVEQADMYEEEDFNMNTYGFSFYREASNDDLRHILLSALGQLKLNSQEILDEKVMLSKILSFELNFFDCCHSLSKLTSATVEQSTQEAHRCALISDDALQFVKRSLPSFQPDQQYYSNFVDLCFDCGVNRPLMGNSPVRKVNFKSVNESVSVLLKITSELAEANCGLLLQGSTSLRRTLNMLKRLSTKDCNILVRSVIVLNLYFDDLIHGRHILGKWISDAMYQDGVPRAVLESEYGAILVNRLGKPVYDFLKLLAMNRCRQRAFIDTYLKDWAVLQKEANTVDFYFREDNSLIPGTTPPFVTNWIFVQTVFLMEHYIGLSIDTGLVHEHHELVIAYWYWNFLLSAHLNVTNSLVVAKAERDKDILNTRKDEMKIAPTADSQQKSGTRKTDKAKKKKGKHAVKKVPGSADQVEQDIEFNEENFELDMEHLLLGVLRSICRGIFQSIVACYQAGVLKKPQEYRFTSNKVIFNKRFESFSVIPQPPLLTYEDFFQGSDYADMNQTDLLVSATDSFKSAKAILDKILSILGDSAPLHSPIRRDEAICLAKVCVGNTLFLHRLMQNVNAGTCENCSVEFDFNTHKQFCSMKII